jgi:diacylglycerol O-acyltransferase
MAAISTRAPERRRAGMSQFRRMSPVDTLQLRTESLSTPTHIGGLCVIEAGPLLDARGELDLTMIARRLDARLTRTPELRRIIMLAPPLGGPPVWVDDPHFSISQHIHTRAAPPPGDEASLLDTAELLLRPLLDRSRPPWELWLITGLEGGRLGLLFKLHHVLADGLAAVALMSSFFDPAPDAPDPPVERWRPVPAPSHRALIADNLRLWMRKLASVFNHPLQTARAVASAAAYSSRTLSQWNAAPHTSLNRLVSPGRFLREMRLDLETVRAVAHAHGATVNDVVITLADHGVRALLAERSDPAQWADLIVGMPVTFRRAGAARALGNAVGAFVARLPTGDDAAGRRLERISTSIRAAKVEQPVSRQNTALALGLVGWLATRGISFNDHQRMINFLVSDLIGPAQPLYVLGARIEGIFPVIGLSGNLTLTCAAMSYCGRLALVTVADRTACPDIDTFTSGMRKSWEELALVASPS